MLSVARPRKMLRGRNVESLYKKPLNYLQKHEWNQEFEMILSERYVSHPQLDLNKKHMFHKDALKNFNSTAPASTQVWNKGPHQCTLNDQNTPAIPDRLVRVNSHHKT